MNTEMKKRITTSVILLILLALMHIYSFILFISLIIIAIISWIEFYALISKIFLKNDLKHIIFRFFYKSISLFFLSSLVFLILFIKSEKPELKFFITYSLCVAIISDIGGLIFGKIFKGKKLTRISPKKTFSGSIGSFILSIMLVPTFIYYDNSFPLVLVTIITLIISFASQVGDLFISFLKRKASVKDTGDLLPGHGGFLDRIDGILFAIPVGIILFRLI
tara:strand:+ start:469 stop:1131 length:663 start_codon:yes stop_codon:yes gene_type:complete